MGCPHAPIEAALDRWSECHWHIHQMEANYHTPDLFRYSLNSFLRAVKEIPQILKMELQNHPEYKSQFKVLIDSLRSNELLSLLHKKRDFIVHQGMLEILSKGSAGTTEGRGIKVLIGFNVAPHETTQEAYERFKALCKANKFIRGIAGPDCDSWPIIRREWKVPEFADRELLELSIDAWALIGQVVSEIVVILGGGKLDLSFSCKHEPETVKTMEFSQVEFFNTVDGIDIGV
jgi:hypothetical protein